MNSLAIRKETLGTVEQICEKVTEAIKPIGFGVLTRIDFDQKIKEKLNEKMNKTVILGACNPKLADEAYKQSTDVAQSPLIQAAEDDLQKVILAL